MTAELAPQGDTWYANKNIKGIVYDKNGKVSPHEFKRGEPIPDVHRWPSFQSIKNVGWIVPVPPVPLPTKIGPSHARVAPIKPVAKKGAEEKLGISFSCTLEGCGKSFTTSRGMKVHMGHHDRAAKKAKK